MRKCYELRKWDRLSECLIISWGTRHCRCIYTACQDGWKCVFRVNISKAKITMILDTHHPPRLRRPATSPKKELSNPALNWALIRFRRKRKHFVAMQIFAHGEQRRRGKETDAHLKRSREYNLWYVPFNPLGLSKLLTWKPPVYIIDTFWHQKAQITRDLT